MMTALISNFDNEDSALAKFQLIEASNLWSDLIYFVIFFAVICKLGCFVLSTSFRAFFHQFFYSFHLILSLFNFLRVAPLL